MREIRYQEPERRRALCRIQEADDKSLIPRDLTPMEVVGVTVAVVSVLVFLLLLKGIIG